MANNREEKNPFGTDPQQAARAQQVYDQLHTQYYDTDSEEEQEVEHTHGLRQTIHSPPWEYARVGNTNAEVRRYPNQAPNLLSPYDDSDDSDESYYEADDVEPFMRRHELMGRQPVEEKITIPDVDLLTLLDRVEESDLEQAIKLSLEEFNAKEKMEKIKLEQEKKKQEEERIREEIIKNYEGLLLQQKEKKPTTTKFGEGVVDSEDDQFFCENPPEDSEEEEDESAEEIYYSD